MLDINSIIAANISQILKKQNKKQIDLAEALNINKQTISKMLNGSRTIYAAELKLIAEFLGVKMEELTKVHEALVRWVGNPILLEIRTSLFKLA